MKTKLVLILGIIIATGIGAMFLFLRNTDEPDSAGNSTNLIIGKNAIYVAEQPPSNSVSIEIVRLEAPGFAVVHENANEAPGGILGISNLIMAGETKNLQVPLSRSTINEETIYAMLHFDNGDGVFDAIKDKPVLDPLINSPMMTIVVIGKDTNEPDAINP